MRPNQMVIASFLGLCKENLLYFKVIIYSVVSLSMTDNEIIKLVWGVMVLKQRFEDDPYSLSVEEIELLREHYKRQTC